MAATHTQQVKAVETSAKARVARISKELETSRIACRDAAEDAEGCLVRAMQASAAHLATLARARAEFEAAGDAGIVQPDGSLVIGGKLYGVAEPSSVMASMVTRVSLVTLGQSHPLTMFTRRWGGLAPLHRSGWLAGLPDVTAESIYAERKVIVRENDWPGPIPYADQIRIGREEDGDKWPGE